MCPQDLISDFHLLAGIPKSEISGKHCSLDAQLHGIVFCIVNRGQLKMVDVYQSQLLGEV